MLSFTFNGKNSFADFGVYIEKRPIIPSPERRVSYFTMPGRSGSLRYDEGSYEDITLSVSCGIVGNIDDKISRIKAWLFESGEADLVFSFSPYRKYIAQVANRIDFEIALKRISTFAILFHCHPFQYAVNNVPLTVTTSGTNLINTGSIASEPVIEVFGSGDAVLNIGLQTLELKNISEKIIINAVLQEVYSEDFQNRNNLMQSEFPVLSVGDNEILWTGNITKLVITPNTRWL